MNIWEFNLKIYLKQDVKTDEALEKIGSFIDKSFLKDEELKKFHKDVFYKGYSFGSFFPLEKDGIYRKGKIYEIKIRTILEKLGKHFEKFLPEENTLFLKGLEINKKRISYKPIEKIYSVTSAVLKEESGYWRNELSEEDFIRRLKENLVKKYNSFYEVKIKEEFQLFNSVSFDNRKPIGVKYKDIRILGDKITIQAAKNETAQKLLFMALGTGILEMNSRGFGFCNFRNSDVGRYLKISID